MVVTLGKRPPPFRTSRYREEAERLGSASKILLVSQPISPLEAVNASASVNQLLLAGKERMALGAQFYLQLLLDRASFKGLPTSAGDDCFTIVGMDLFLHVYHLFPRKYQQSNELISVMRPVAAATQIVAKFSGLPDDTLEHYSTITGHPARGCRLGSKLAVAGSRICSLPRFQRNIKGWRY